MSSPRPVSPRTSRPVTFPRPMAGPARGPPPGVIVAPAAKQQYPRKRPSVVTRPVSPVSPINIPDDRRTPRRSLSPVARRSSRFEASAGQVGRTSPVRQPFSSTRALSPQSRVGPRVDPRVKAYEASQLQMRKDLARMSSNQRSPRARMASPDRY